MKPRLITLVAVACCVAASAQTPTVPRNIDDVNDAIVLSPFEVKADSTAGYLASESTTGTRYAAPVAEIPFPVNVISSEFIENFLAFDFFEVVSYTSSFTPTEGTGAFTLRGVRNFSHYKNGIREGGVYSPSSVDRVEIIKGGNAAIYGQTEPTGLRNIVTKKAGNKPQYVLRLNGGTDDFGRVMVDVNQPVIANKLLTRFAASTEQSEQYAQEFSRFERKTFYNSTTLHVTPNTTLTTNAEYIQFRSSANGADLPFVISPVALNGGTANQVSGIFGRGEWERYYELGLAGPFGYNDVRYAQIDGTLSHRFNEVLSMRFLGSFWDRDQDIIRTTNFTGADAGAYSTATGTLMGSIFPQLERNRQYQKNAQVDVLAHFRTGAIEHKLLVTADWMNGHSDARRRRSSRPDAVFSLSKVLSDGEYFSTTFPYTFDFWNGDVWNVNNTDTRAGNEVKGVMISERAAFWNGKLIAFIGARHDELTDHLTNYLGTIVTNDGRRVPPGQKVVFDTAKANTIQTGLVYKLSRNLSAFANYSESFTPQRQDIATNIDERGIPLPPMEGSGYEFGVKASLLNERLNFTLGYFDIVKSNNPRVALDELGNPLFVPGTMDRYSKLADISSKGVELDFNWQVTEALGFFGGLGWNDAIFSAIPNATESFLIGIPPAATPEWGGGVSAEYRFRHGPLKGVSARIGVRYQGEMLINTSTHSIYGDSGIAGPGVVVNGTRIPTYYFLNDDYWLVDFGVAYTWGEGKYKHRASIDMKNLLDERYLRIRKPGDMLSVNASYEIKF